MDQARAIPATPMVMIMVTVPTAMIAVICPLLKDRRLAIVPVAIVQTTIIDDPVHSLSCIVE